MDSKKYFLLSAAIAGLTLGVSTGGESKSSKTNSEKSTIIVGECHGVNSCKGTSACTGKENTCAVKNFCKGKGWIKLSKKECDKKKGRFKEGLTMESSSSKS